VDPQWSPPDVPATPTAHQVRWGLGDFLWIWPAGIVGSFILLAIAFGITGDEAEHPAALTIALGVAGQFGGWLVALYVVARTKGRSLRADFGLVVRIGDSWALLVGVVLLFVLGVLVLPIRSLVEGHNQQVVEDLQDAGGAKLAVLVGVAALVAPITEELLFRGLLQRALRRRLSPGLAIGIAAAVFAFAHPLLDPSLGTTAIVPALFALGAISGIAAEWTGDLSLSIFLHVGFNLVTVLAALLS
jgi:membrane protease YdiL (CAAX protease family)